MKILLIIIRCFPLFGEWIATCLLRLNGIPSFVVKPISNPYETLQETCSNGKSFVAWMESPLMVTERKRVFIVPVPPGTSMGSGTEDLLERFGLKLCKNATSYLLSIPS